MSSLPYAERSEVEATANPVSPPVRDAEGAWEYWTHHLGTTQIHKVGDVDICGHYWMPGEVKILPARVHALADAMGLEYRGAA